MTLQLDAIRAKLQVPTEGDLRREISNEHQTFNGFRLLSRSSSSSWLPVRGQRTKTNARTRKGP